MIDPFQVLPYIFFKNAWLVNCNFLHRGDPAVYNRTSRKLYNLLKLHVINGNLFILIGTKPRSSYLPLSCKDRAKTNNTDQRLSSTIKRLERRFPFAYAGNADRSNIPNEVRQHDPDNCHNKDKRHFYLLWCGLDFHCDSWLDPLCFG